ncbi:MAG: hypothetical protein BGO67_09610 [Alphaproteobacteria bacterium 41-28]|nr:MAG: hypothetical protein BGO67_09610 [Alphaproteobacteria bacterium 41-28]
MYKIFKIAFYVLLSTLWINETLYAVGGVGVEKVSDEEIKSKGILKIKSADGHWIATGVLFQEGQGQLGLSAKHVFAKFDRFNVPFLAYFGEEEREIVKIYTPEEKDGLSLFVLSSPFKNLEELPSLPESSSDSSLVEGCLYGFGYTTASTHQGSLENSIGICRKGKFIVSPMAALGENSKERFAPIVSSTFLKLKKSDPKDMAREFPENNPNNAVSTCYALSGDSGGPLIDMHNQVYAIHTKVNYNFKSIWILHKKFYPGKFRTLYEVPFDDKYLLPIGFMEGEKNLCFYKEDDEFLVSYRAIKEAFAKELINYFNNGQSRYLHTLVLEEEKDSASSRPLAEWLEAQHLFLSSSFTPLSHPKSKDWIDRVMIQALEDCQTGEIEKSFQNLRRQVEEGNIPQAMLGAELARAGFACKEPNEITPTKVDNKLPEQRVPEQRDEREQST